MSRPIQPPLLLYDETAARLHRLIRDDLHVDHALVCGQLRLEYIQLAYGYPFYRVRWRGRVVGQVDVTSPKKIPGIHFALACHLAAYGARADCAIVKYAPVGWGTQKWRQPVLWPVA